MKNTHIFLSIVLFTHFHLCYTAPENFLHDQEMAWAAEKIIERSKNNDATVTHVKRDHIDEYSCDDATGQYRVQVDAHKKTVSIGWGTSDHNFPFVLLITQQELLEQHDVLAKGGTVTKKYGHNNTVTKMWSKKSGETTYWSSAVLPLTFRALVKQAHSRRQEAERMVVVPSYNNEKWFRKNLESVINKLYFDFASPVKPFVKDEGKVNVKQHVGVDLSIMHNKFVVIDGHSDSLGVKGIDSWPHIVQFMQHRSSRVKDEVYGTIDLEPQCQPVYGLTKEESERMADEIAKDIDAKRVPHLIGKSDLADKIFSAKAEEIKKSRS